MIKYQLKCGSGCSFEGWFRSSEDFDQQAGAAQLECPACGSTEVSRAIMAPAIVRRADQVRKSDRASAISEIMAEAARRARDYVEKNFDYVGEKFPEEARRIHYGETKDRAIYGEATPAEARELVDEGLSIAPLPLAPGAPPAIKKKAS
jgi:hypothetical protein